MANKFTSLSHDEYYEQMCVALTKELDARYAQAKHESVVRSTLEMFQMRNGAWFFTYRCEDGSFGFEYSDEVLGVPSWMGWVPESVSAAKAAELANPSDYVFIDQDRTRVYPVPSSGVPRAHAEYEASLA